MTGRTLIPRKILLFLLALTLLLPYPVGGAAKTVALFPLVVYSDQPKAFLGPGLKSMFVSRLSGEGLELVSDERIYPLLREKEREGMDSRERAEELARSLKADYAVFGSVTSIGAGYSLDLSILDLTKEAAELTRVSEAVQEDELIPKLADVVYDFRAIMAGVDIRASRRAGPPPEPEDRGAMGLFFKPGSEDREFKPSGGMTANMGVMGFDTGDLDGDGLPEIAVLGRDKLLIYNRKDDSLALKGTLTRSLGESFFKVSIGDVNGDGKAEIYLVRSVGLRAETSVWEWTGKFRKLHERNGHMQAVKAPGARPLLLFQESLADPYFSGRIQVMTYGGKGELVQEGILPEFDKGAQFYTLTPLNPQKAGRSEFLGLNNDDYLCLWDQEGGLLWRSDERVGGTNNAITLKKRPADLTPRIASFNSRIVLADIDKDGKKEVLLIDNIPLVDHLVTFRVMVESRLAAYRVEGASLVPKWKTREIPYCLMDMQVEGRTLFLAAQKGSISNIGAGSGRIMWFE
ncbi:MAG: VCBS repeat-containing protein [Proteobacteria bacterium]|nr:VCBS repeat-containing protein [Pseudomonadota bacterium]